MKKWLKRFASLVLGLVMVMGLAMSVSAQQEASLGATLNASIMVPGHEMVFTLENVHEYYIRANWYIGDMNEYGESILVYTATIYTFFFRQGGGSVAVNQDMPFFGYGYRVSDVPGFPGYAPSPGTWAANVPFVLDRVGHVVNDVNAFYLSIDTTLLPDGGFFPDSLNFVLGNAAGTVALEEGQELQPISELVVEGFVPQQPSGQMASAPNLHTASAWGHDAINQAFGLGLIPDELQNNYSLPTSRAMFAAFAVALYEAATGREIAGRAEFNDTADINVQKMGYLEVVTGVGGGNFAPNDGLTREQAAVMIARLAYAIGQPLPAAAPTFADNAQISSWAADAVGQVQAAGIMGGVGGGNFAPGGDYTREQSIITMLRLFEILQ